MHHDDASAVVFCQTFMSLCRTLPSKGADKKSESQQTNRLPHLGQSQTPFLGLPPPALSPACETWGLTREKSRIKIVVEGWN